MADFDLIKEQFIEARRRNESLLPTVKKFVGALQGLVDEKIPEFEFRHSWDLNREAAISRTLKPTICLWLESVGFPPDLREVFLHVFEILELTGKRHPSFEDGTVMNFNFFVLCHMQVFEVEYPTGIPLPGPKFPMLPSQEEVVGFVKEAVQLIWEHTFARARIG